MHVGHTAIAGRIAPGEDHEPEDVADDPLAATTGSRGEFQVRLGID